MNIQSPKAGKIPQHRMSIDEFFAWTETQERRYELVDGVPHLLPWVKRNHSLIATNVVIALGAAIDLNRFSVHTGEFATKTGQRSIRFADVMVEPAGAPGDQRTTEHAILLVEVLSDSTARSDFGPKLREYKALSTVATYLIVAQDERCVWNWSRDADGRWPEEPAVIKNGEITLPELNVVLTLDQIYRGVH